MKKLFLILVLAFGFSSASAMDFKVGDRFVYTTEFGGQKYELLLTLVRWQNESEGKIIFTADSKMMDPSQPQLLITGIFNFVDKDFFEDMKKIIFRPKSAFYKGERIVHQRFSFFKWVGSNKLIQLVNLKPTGSYLKKIHAPNH